MSSLKREEKQSVDPKVYETVIVLTIVLNTNVEGYTTPPTALKDCCNMIHYIVSLFPWPKGRQNKTKQKLPLHVLSSPVCPALQAHA